MFNINGWEMIVLVIVFLLVFGPDRLPEAAVQAGRILRDLRKAADDATGDLSRELEAAAREIRDAESGLKGAGNVAQKALIDAALASSSPLDKKKDKAEVPSSTTAQDREAPGLAEESPPVEDPAADDEPATEPPEG